MRQKCLSTNMEAVEELDVDVEGGSVAGMAEAPPGGSYENPSSSLLQDHYLDSTWRNDTSLPWSLDSTISEEDKAIIEKMLLEEEYYLSINSLPEKNWHALKESDKKCIKSSHKKGKVTLHSPAKPSSGSLKWTLEEKELFEQGLVKFGRRWTKIAMMIGSRSVVQVKSFARHYFKNKIKMDGLEKVEQPHCLNIPVPSNSGDDEEAKAISWACAQLRGRADPNLNAVKIEKLSDDEEVDITDEMDELVAHAPQQEPGKLELLGIPKSPAGQNNCSEPILDCAEHTTTDIQNAKCIPQQNTADSPEMAISYSDRNSDRLVKSDDPKCDGKEVTDGTSWVSSPEMSDEQRDFTRNSIFFHHSDQLEEENQMDADELKPPDQEVEMDRHIILDEEKQAIPEFFVGRQAKTPERYLKIRNYILDQWERIKPKYLNKTSIRLGLKNCGDVNCIGRIHTYLELIGAINFGCEQAVYNRPHSTGKIRLKEGKDTMEAFQLVQRLQSMIKMDGLEKVEQPHCLNIPVPSNSGDDEEAKAISWACTQLRGRADPNLNTVKIEKLSDDEEVDITDEMDELVAHAPQQEPGKLELLGIPKSPAGQINCSEPILDCAEHTTTDIQNARCIPEQNTVDSPEIAISYSDRNSDRLVKSDDPKCDGKEVTDGTSWVSSPEMSDEQRDFTRNSIFFHHSDQLEEENQMDADELKPPDQEVEMDRNIILDEEKQAIPEFFVGRQAKTPERYLKIRNYILDQWERIKPKYLNKTSVRPGLKNCGDVNCIGRIHTYLELIGAINFGCEQAVYNRPHSTDKIRLKEGKDTMEAFQLVQRLQSMRTRRRRVRDPWGNWCDARDLEGQTFEHLSAEELAKRREEQKNKPAKTSKGQKYIKSSFDPFQLIPCCSFTEEKPEPFQVAVAPEALLIMDLHTHVSMAEVIGLLGGRYSETNGIVEIRAAEPCNSLSTGLQCEMDPVSQTHASEALAARGYSIIGWYHSHPAFDPNPSIRDIDTQAKYQSYFSRGGSMFVGVIISPYNRNNPLPYSQITCLVISEETSSDGSYRLPYKFEVGQMLEEPRWELIMEKTRWIIEKYKMSYSCVPMDKIFHRDSDLTCLQKLLECMRKTLENVANSFIAEEFLTQIENLFLSSYTYKKWNDATEEISMSRNDLIT